MGSKLALLIAAGLLAALAHDARAQTRCAEGRTFAGECIVPDVAASARNVAIANAQQKLSYTSPPWLPREDYDYAFVRNHHETANLFTQPPVVRITTHRP